MPSQPQSRPGRNDPCHCGSGRKYKKCHLDHDRHAEGADDARSLFADLVGLWVRSRPAKIPGFDHAAREPVENLRSDFLAKIGSGLAGREAAEALEDYLRVIEEALEEIARSHSRAYWLHLARRMPPDQLDAEWAEWSTRLYLRTFTLGLLKYGLPEQKEQEFQTCEVQGRLMRVPADLSDQDLVALHQMDQLAVEFTSAAASFRRVGKGAELVPEGEGEFATDADPETEALMRQLDERVKRHGGLSERYGFLVDYDLPEQGELPRGQVMVPIPNVQRHSPEKLGKLLGMDFPGPANYTPGFLQLDGFRDLLAMFEADVLAAAGSPPDHLLAVVWALASNLVLRTKHSPISVAEVFTTGYYLVPDARYDDLVDDLAIHVAGWLRDIGGGELPSQERVAKVTREALKAWTYTEADFVTISLWERLPFKLLLPIDGATLVDMAAIPSCLVGLVKTVGFLQGEAGNVKSEVFEDKVESMVNGAGLDTWEKRKTLTAADGNEREVDVSFVAGRTLYLVECKAYAQNPRIDQGDFAALKGRQESLECYLDQARTLAEFLAENRSGRNYAVPKEVESFEHVVCAPAIEYIWSRDPGLWLDSETPRICHPEEMLAFVLRKRDPHTSVGRHPL